MSLTFAGLEYAMLTTTIWAENYKQLCDSAGGLWWGPKEAEATSTSTHCQQVLGTQFCMATNDGTPFHNAKLLILTPGNVFELSVVSRWPIPSSFYIAVWSAWKNLKSPCRGIDISHEPRMSFELLAMIVLCDWHLGALKHPQGNEIHVSKLICL